MNTLFSLVEIAATLTENVVAFSAVTQMNGQKYTGKKHLILLWGIASIMMVFVSFLNSLEAFSFVTIGICFCFVAIGTKFTSNGTLLRRLTATIVAYLVIHAVDYIVLFAFGFMLEAPVNDFHSFSFVVVPGVIRCIFLVINKLADVMIYYFVQRTLKRVREIPAKHGYVLFGISSLAYLVMSVLLSLLFEESIFVMQTAIMLSWAFLVICVVMVIIAFVIITNYQQEKHTNNLLRVANELMTRNYQQTNAHKLAADKKAHDFYKHLDVIRDYAYENDTKKVADYLNSLLETAYKKIPMCCSGNDVIDSIINCKAAEAREEHITFEYKIDEMKLKGIDPVDICAILANQIDNALEACRLIEKENSRKVEVRIWKQTEKMVFFQVSNSVLNNPFNDNEALASTKADTSHLHGLGILNIKATAEKYQGELRNTYQNDRFISTVFLCYNHLNTNFDII